MKLNQAFGSHLKYYMNRIIQCHGLWQNICRFGLDQHWRKTFWVRNSGEDVGFSHRLLGCRAGCWLMAASRIGWILATREWRICWQRGLCHLVPCTIPARLVRFYLLIVLRALFSTYQQSKDIARPLPPRSTFNTFPTRLMVGPSLYLHDMLYQN